VAQVTVGKWGNNLAVRLPGDIVRLAKLRDGERVELEAQAGEIVIRRIEPDVSLVAMFAGGTPDEWRALYADAYDWGPDVGREIVVE
jgi:antitoxin component of MazEF toxin-antitoxin module